MSNLVNSLEWRYASKQMNGKKVPQEKVDYILEAIRLAPTSLGLQALKVLVVESDELKKQLHPVCYNQPQILTCSHLLVFAVYKSGYDKLKEDFVERIAETRNIPVEAVSDYSQRMDMFLGLYEEDEAKVNWAEKQAYIALGIGLAAAAEMQVDSTPMEGFIPEEVDKVLGLEEKNLHSCLIMPIGYRDPENDFLVDQKKVRKSKEDFIEFL